ncbi:MAG: hypothetical protein ACLUAR_12915 [Pilosibacter sp.]
MPVSTRRLRRLDIKDKRDHHRYSTKVDRPDADTACRDMSADYKVRIVGKDRRWTSGNCFDLFAVILRKPRDLF